MLREHIDILIIYTMHLKMTTKMTNDSIHLFYRFLVLIVLCVCFISKNINDFLFVSINVKHTNLTLY